MRNRTVALALAALTAFTALPLAANADQGKVNVYTDPGQHFVNGREWRTECSAYDANITRCRADIKSEGKWVFNNLTYLAVDRKFWNEDPLSRPGAFTSAGREWITSCNDDWTGKNACRSFIRSGNKWVFNNLVYFTPGTVNFPEYVFNQATGRLVLRSEANKPAPPAPTPTPTTPAKPAKPEPSLNRGYSSGLDQVNENTKSVVRHVWANWSQIKTMYGWRRDTTPDHPAGRAVDIMLPSYKQNKALGQEIAAYYRANHKTFNIEYIIFNQQIWSVARDREGWRKMADRGGDTANHVDHVHVNTYAVR